jgi:hypothetical protein
MPMSEYQYYEFQAIDRRLTAGEMAKLRSFSTRARITPTGFVNDYQWGEFKGNEDAWMDKYFDAFLYFANWGTRVLKLRLPSPLLDRATEGAYCIGESASVREHEDKTILTFVSDQEEDEWPEESDALSVLTPIRTQIGRGDLRSLYLGWLLSAQTGEVEDDEIEPPVPPGLKDLDGSLERLVDFLRIDTDLLKVAATASAAMQGESLSRKEIRKWIAGQTAAQKDDYLERFIVAEDPALAAKLQRMAGNREFKAALARAKYLGEITKKEPAVWDEIESLIAKQPASYDRAVGLLIDLRDAAAAQGREEEFMNRFEILRKGHARKPSLLSKFQRSGLR